MKFNIRTGLGWGGKLLSFVNAGKHQNTAGVILSAGVGQRMGKSIPKQFLEIDGIPVLIHSVLAFDSCSDIDSIVIVTRPEDIGKVGELCRQYDVPKKPYKIVPGGKTRQESAYFGAQAVNNECKVIAIHDAARCLVTPDIVSRVCSEAYRHSAASAGCPVFDTVKKVNSFGIITETVPRDQLMLAQTPQVFKKNLYIASAAYVLDHQITVTDDNSVLEAVGYKVRIVNCGIENFKVTTPSDLVRAEAVVKDRKSKQEPEV